MIIQLETYKEALEIAARTVAQVQSTNPEMIANAIENLSFGEKRRSEISEAESDYEEANLADKDSQETINRIIIADDGSYTPVMAK